MYKDKKTPKKPLVIKYKNSEHYFCPNCEKHRFGILDYGEYKNEWRKDSKLTPYCPYCGEEIDWGDEDVESTLTGGYSKPYSEYVQNLMYKPINPQNITLNDADLFIIIKALFWYSPTTPLPSDEEIKKFIKVHREKENEK